MATAYPKKLLQGALDPSSDPWQASLPTGRVFLGTSAAALGVFQAAK